MAGSGSGFNDGSETLMITFFRFGRVTKFRHMKGTPLHKSKHFENLKNLSKALPAECDFIQVPVVLRHSGTGSPPGPGSPPSFR